MPAKIDLTGQIFGRLFVLQPAPTIDKKTRWCCWCACGNSCTKTTRNLRIGEAQSCGCRLREHYDGSNGPNNWKHGESIHGKKTTRYKMWEQAKLRAKKKGLSFNICWSDIEIPERCPVLGKPLKSSGKRGQNDWSPTLDRVIPALGYVRGNVRVISWRANRLKSNSTPKELQLIVDYMRAEEANVIRLVC